MDEVVVTASYLSTMAMERFNLLHERLQPVLQEGGHALLHALRGLFVASIVLGFVGLVLVATLVGCVCVSIIASILIRQYVLFNAPSNRLFSVQFNTLPLETEPWRLQQVRDAISRLSAETHIIPHNGCDIASLKNSEVKGGARFIPLEEQAALLKMSIVSNLVKSMVATGTFVIPSHVRGEVFLPDGGVSIEGLFRQPSPMFSARATYRADAQLVFVKEEASRDVAMMLESSMLISDDPYAPQSIGSLHTLFKTTASFTLTTGERGGGWLTQLKTILVNVFCFAPMWFVETLFPILATGVFPAYSGSTEVAVVVPLYSDFEPPLYLQPRLRAINFTLYQVGAEGGAKVSLKRVDLFTSVQLSGLAYYFSTYSLSSVAGAIFILLILTGSVASALLIVVAIVLLLMRLNSTANKRDDAVK
ncbi:hypothetical protein ERJ75_000361300 [Trypanosoma vivax]|nr:hypothetical protein ERJ75_000361300 [Trypanosoma vivax]